MRLGILWRRPVVNGGKFGWRGNVRGFAGDGRKKVVVEDADVVDVPVPPMPAGMRQLNPFEASWQEKWVPNTPQIMNIFVGVVMLGTVLKVARDRGENIEKERRMTDRIETTKLEIEELKDRLPGVLADAVLELPVSKRGDNIAIRTVISQKTEEMLLSVKTSAIKRFEASLWEEDKGDAAVAAPPPTQHEQPVSTTKRTEAPEKETRMY